MCGQKVEKHTGEQVTLSLMGQEGTKGDFGACGVCLCVRGRKMLQSLCFYLGLYLCFRCVLTSLQGQAFLFCFLLLFSLTPRLNVCCWMAHVSCFVTQRVTWGWWLISWKYTFWPLERGDLAQDRCGRGSTHSSYRRRSTGSLLFSNLSRSVRVVRTQHSQQDALTSILLLIHLVPGSW